MESNERPIPEPPSRLMEKPGLLEKLLGKLLRPPPTLAALVGPPFSGKTVLAATMAITYRDTLNADVIWLDAADGEPENLREFLRWETRISPQTLVIIDHIPEPGWPEAFIGDYGLPYEEAVPPCRTLLVASGLNLSACVRVHDILEMPPYSSRQCAELFEAISGFNTLGDRRQSGALKKLVKALDFRPGLVLAAAKRSEVARGGPLGLLLALERGDEIEGERI